MAAEQVSGVSGPNQTIAQLGEVMRGAGERTIGALVFWSLSGVNVARAEFRAAFEGIGMGAAVPRDPRQETSLTTAVKAVAVGKRDVVVRRVGKGWGVVLEAVEVDNARDPRLKLAHALSVHVESGDIRRPAEDRPGLRAPELRWSMRTTGTPGQIGRAKAIAEEIESAYLEARRAIDTSDLSQVLVNCCHGTTRDTLLGAVSLRQTSGGLYFVHASKVDLARQLSDVVAQLAPKCSITVLTVTGNADNLAAAALAARAGFASQLAELRAEVRDFRQSTPLGDRTERNVSVRMAHFRALADRVGLFRDVLGTIADELGEHIEEARGEVERLLDAD